ncbi:MAG: amidohydrolase [Ruminococcaceae bacterium]|nr:amidohydrolase [Oscillospiraceae bacterium]
MIITNVNIETLTSAGIIRGGWIFIRDGKIKSVGTGQPPADERIIDGHGGYALPGFIDAHTHLGLCEDSLDFEGDDTNEDSEPSMPHLRAIDGINPFDRYFAEARESGITTAAVAPGSANPIGGQVCVVKTVGRRIDKMTILAPAAIKFALGENPKSTYHAKNESPVTRMATAAIIRETLYKAQRYLSDKERAAEDEDFDEPEYDMQSEALLPLLRGEITAHFHAHRADDICTALRISDEFNLRPVIVHGTEGYLIADELSGIPVIAGPNLCDRSKPELRGQTMDNPRILNESGVLCALTTDHPVTPLPYLTLAAAMALKNGMSREDALRAITVNPAKILGIDNRVGTIEPGKDADIVITNGDPLGLSYEILSVIIDGNEVYTNG